MKTIKVKCPKCKSENISKNGVTLKKQQRYICNNKDCNKKSFRLEYEQNGSKHGINETIISMSINGSGIRDISRVLKVSLQKVVTTLKKQKNG